MKDHFKESSKYDDIIDREHPVSATHPRMSIYDRAAQFSPFAALTGHDAAIKETARQTEQRMILDENSQQLLNERLQIIRDQIKSHPRIVFTYFQEDPWKDGGDYVTVIGEVKKIKETEQVIYLTDGQCIDIRDIVNVEGELFNSLF